MNNYLCHDMNQLVIWECIDNLLSISFIILGYWACKAEKTNFYDRFLFVLLADASFKIVIFSYYLSFPAVYITWCIVIDKEGLYPFMIVDGIAFLVFFYIGVSLRACLSSKIFGF